MSSKKYEIYLFLILILKYCEIIANFYFVPREIIANFYFVPREKAKVKVEVES